MEELKITVRPASCEMRRLRTGGARKGFERAYPRLGAAAPPRPTVPRRGGAVKLLSIVDFPESTFGDFLDRALPLGEAPCGRRDTAQRRPRQSLGAGSFLIKAYLHSVIVIAGVCISTGLMCLSAIKCVFIGIKVAVDYDYFAIRQRYLFCEKSL
jgi:hypothetical protein